MQVTTSQMFRSQTERMQELQTQIGKIQLQMSTGKRLAAGSDDPVAFSEAARLQAHLSQVNQFEDNVVSARSRLGLQEQALGAVATSLIRIKELTVQASTDTVDTSSKREISIEIEGLRESMMGFANASDENGAALFGGFFGGQRPFVLDGDKNVTYLGDDNQVKRSIGFGLDMTVNSTGQEVFMQVPTSNDGQQSLFALVKQVMDNLNAGGSPDGFQPDLTAALNHITQYQTKTGTRMARLDEQRDSLEAEALSAKSQLSLLQDANLEELATVFKQKITSLEASQSSFVQIANLSLFNYMK